ncbi:MAG: sensor histidine kinase [Actinomycetes bacterium]
MTDQALAPHPPPFARGTLGRQLLVRVVLLVAIAAVLLSGATILATRTLLVQQVDNALDTATGRFRREGGPDRNGPRGGLLQPGQPIGTVAAFFPADGSEALSGRLVERGPESALPASALSRLQEVAPTGNKQTVDLGDLRRYRVVAYDANRLGQGTVTAGTVVVGIPLAEVDQTLAQLLGLGSLLSLLATGGAVLAARAVVSRSLRPLNRLASTAQQVSQLRLDKGDVALAVRVPPEDADPASEVGRVGEAFNHMLTNVGGALAARQASEMKVRQFVADASHELRNPLAAIRGYAELTRRSRDDVPPDTAHAMGRVESEAGRMSRLVEDLLLLARLDSGPDLAREPVDLTELVLNAVSDARAAGPEHIWTMVLPEVPVMAIGDTHRLYQVLANLLGNARTHTPPGTRVETGLAVAADQAVLTVTDNGPGIPAEIQPRVFQRFTRGDVSRARSGAAGTGGSTGLGLAIVAAVVEAHAGRVEVASQPGLTRFTVRLPMAGAATPGG